MTEAAYAVAWSPEAVEGLTALGTGDQLDVLNNVMTLSRNPYPAGVTTIREIAEDTFHLRVGPVSVVFRVIGFTVIIDLIAVPKVQ